MSDTKLREFWIAPEDPDDTDYFGYALVKHPHQGPLDWQASLVHVVELPADSIVLTRERLREVWQKLTGPHRNDVLEALAYELFEKGRGE